MDQLLALGALGVDDPLPAGIDQRSRAALRRELEREGDSPRARATGWRRRVSRPRLLMLIPVALVMSAAVAVAATRVIAGLNPSKIAAHNVRDTPLQLFERNPDVIGATPAAEWRQTVIPSTVRQLGVFTVAGVGRIQYWVAATKQHGVCGALRLPDGDWAGLQNRGKDGGSFPGCYPTRRQVGGGALIIDGFDFIEATVPSDNGQRWYIIYGAVSSAQAPVRVRDTFSGRNASLVRDHYFAIALHPVGNDYGDDVHLQAFDAAGQRVANQGTALAGTPIVKCVGRYDVHRVRIPNTHRTAPEWKCRRYAKTVAK